MIENIKNNIQKLPTYCYAVHPHTKKPIVLFRGFVGFFETTFDLKDTMEINCFLNITKQQIQAMLIGAMFGFHVRGADPDIYDDDCKVKKEKIMM